MLRVPVHSVKPLMHLQFPCLHIRLVSHRPTPRQARDCWHCSKRRKIESRDCRTGTRRT